MRLKPSSYLILGMVDRGVETGYAIKRAVDLSTRFFWAASLAQVYPELAALEEGGYVLSADEPRGARPRKTYRLTERAATPSRAGCAASGPLTSSSATKVFCACSSLTP